MGSGEHVLHSKFYSGERIALKDNSPVYSPGNNSLTIPSYGDVSTKNKQANNARQQKKDKGKKSNFNVSKVSLLFLIRIALICRILAEYRTTNLILQDTTPSSPEMLINEGSNGATRMKRNKSKKTATKKERTLQRETSGSSEDKDIVVQKVLLFANFYCLFCLVASLFF